MKTIKIGMIGYGTVGQGVAEVLEKNAHEISRRTGYNLQIVEVAKRNWDKTNYPFKCSTDPFSVVNNPEIDVILELAGGEEPARSLIINALQQGKHVITANKALIAKHGQELFALAREQGLELAYEASVAGGIPVIKVLREGMSANEISVVAGIINGTSNFILTEMSQKKRSFADVLREAQALGYAEADPSFDINGTDAAHKITILAAIAFGIPLQFDKIYIEGIEKISTEDIENAASLGFKIKHLGMAVRRNDGVEIRVHPTLIPEEALLSSVNGVMNAVQVKGNAIGNSLYYGPGAGRLPTASAVVADLIDIVRELNLSREDRLREFGYQEIYQDETLPVLPREEFFSAYYLRMNITNRAGVLADITTIMAKYQISIQSIIQKNGEKNNDAVPLILLTERVLEKQMQQALQEIAKLDSMRGEIQTIRVEYLA